MAVEDDFIGTGWSFPPAFDMAGGRVAMSSGIADIEESLRIIFTTHLGERIMQPQFGAALDQHVFDPMNSSRLSYLEDQIKRAILYHEARIDADEAHAAEGDLALLQPDLGAGEQRRGTAGDLPERRGQAGKGEPRHDQRQVRDDHPAGQ